MSKNLEIEHKFLIGFPNLNLLPTNQKTLDITQIYLKSNENFSQRRVRKTVFNNNITLTYTEKNFISALIRQENEMVISQEQFDFFIRERDISKKIIHKKRIVFDFKNQTFELDIYPFSNEYAILEIELENENQNFILPDFLNVVKDVSDDKNYSNSSLTNNNTFPQIY